MRKDEDADYGLTPREWLDSDPVPLTPDIDFNDPEQRIAWIRANNEEMYQRGLELEARRAARRGGRATGDTGSGSGSGEADDPRPRARSGATTVVTVRLLNAEHRSLVRTARRFDLTVSDLVRRWVRDGLAEANDTDPAPPEDSEEAAQRRALADGADAAVARITDELRRLREMIAAVG